MKRSILILLIFFATGLNVHAIEDVYATKDLYTIKDKMYLIDCMRAELTDRKHRINIHSMLCVGSGMIKNKGYIILYGR